GISRLKEIGRRRSCGEVEASGEDYRRLVVVENVLGKGTETTRQESLRRLRELYALSHRVPIFAVYQELMKFDPQSAPLLSLLITWARDPLLRATTPVILNAAVGARVTRDEFQQTLPEAYPHQ